MNVIAGGLGSPAGVPEKTLRVLVVDEDVAPELFEPRSDVEVVHVASVSEIRARLREESFDVVVADEARLRSVLEDVAARQEAERALARSEARLAEAQRVAHVGSWEWDVGADRVTWSDELYRIYGLDETRFGGDYQSFLSRVHPDDLEATKAVVGRALAEVTPFVYEHRILRPDGGIRMLHTRGEVIANGEGRPARLVGSCWDITDRWEVTQRLEHSVSLLRATLEATADGLLVVDREGKVTARNEPFLAMWRLPHDVGPGTDDQRLLDMVREQLEEPDAFLRKVAELYERPEAESFDVLRLRDGRVFERVSRPQRLAKQICGRVWSFRDVTELRSSRDQLRALAARLDAVREEERRLIAREIHDQIGQALTALKLDSGWLRKHLPPGTDPAVAGRLAATERLLDETLETARRVASALRPALLDDVGVAAAIDWQGHDFSVRTGVTVTAELPPPAQPLDPATSLALFRIAQEALTNVARHAG